MNQEKSKYSEPQIKIVLRKAEDVLTTSVSHNDIPEEWGIDLPIDPFEP